MVVAPVVADLALSAVVTASSYSNGQVSRAHRLRTAVADLNLEHQPPSAAIDGLIGGFTSSGGIYTQEWVSAGGGAGTTFALTWASTVNVGQVVLYDRPNPADQVLFQLCITFSFAHHSFPGHRRHLDVLGRLGRPGPFAQQRWDGIVYQHLPRT